MADRDLEIANLTSFATRNFPNWRDYWQAGADAGVFRTNVPKAFGGLEHSATQVVQTMVALGRASADAALPMGINSQIWTVQEPLLAFGTDDQKAHYLPRLMSGKMISAFALTEAEAGSDAMSMSTTAKRDQDTYVLNGAKCLIGLATECDLALVFASTAPEKKSWGISAFLVEKTDAGFLPGPEQQKIGLTSLPMGEMRFDDCVIPVERRLGPEGAGARIFQATMDWERSFLFATQVGAMERQLAEAIEFARDRQVFGQKINAFQSVSNRIADMAVRLETCQLMLEKAARLKDEAALDSSHAAMTKLHLSECLLASSIDAMRIRGGAGYLAGSPAGEAVKDSLGGVIYSGTSDVQRNVISRLQEAKHR